QVMSSRAVTRLLRSPGCLWTEFEYMNSGLLGRARRAVIRGETCCHGFTPRGSASGAVWLDREGALHLHAGPRQTPRRPRLELTRNPGPAPESFFNFRLRINAGWRWPTPK